MGRPARRAPRRSPLAVLACCACLALAGGARAEGGGAPVPAPAPAPAPAAKAPAVELGPRTELYVCSARVLRVLRRPTDAKLGRESLVARTEWPSVGFKVSRDGDGVTVETELVRAFYNRSDDTVAFFDKASSRMVLSERGYSFQHTVDIGQPAYQVEQSWHESAPDEGLYGGGQYQNGVINFKNAPLEMVQFNTEAVVPFFWSTAGYGLLWDNYAWTFLNPPAGEPLVPVGGPMNGSRTFAPVADGDHFFFVGRGFPAAGAVPSFGRPGKLAQVNVTDTAGGGPTVVQDWAGLQNMPNSLVGRAPALRRGRTYRVDYRWDDGDVGLFVQGPEYGKTTLRSVLGDAVDYYFVLGRTGDEAIAAYRDISGAAPLYARWVYGFWQCKEHYDTQQHLLQAAEGFRNRSIPLDAIVQDWLYWGDLGWGPQWDHKLYPDPAGMVKQLQAMGLHFMVSTWSRFDKKTTFHRRLAAGGLLLGGTEWHDAWNPRAQDMFYDFANEAHFSIGVDSLWLDATEPEFFPNINATCYLGSANAYASTYSLQVTQAIAAGLRRDYPSAQGARVFALTRSAFAGQQRTGAALWSGDITSSWDSLRRQVAASINYQMSGMPYWAQDIGGFVRPASQYVSADYHDLLLRWFQFGVFTPIFRTHGSGTTTEIWHYGDETARRINASAISFRYRLLPYIYTGFARAEFEGYTMQRGLPMDFADPRVRSIADEFMFGDALLVAPILQPAGKAAAETSREVFLPGERPWVHFHTGQRHPSGSSRVTFGLAEAPVLVRAGSIVPLGPLAQSTAAQADPIEVRVYRGADAAFALFEDDGASAAYQRGRASVIRFSWSEAAAELTIGSREGSFDGMLAARTFAVVWVAPGRGVGVTPATPDAVVSYSGAEVVVKYSPAQAISI